MLIQFLSDERVNKNSSLLEKFYALLLLESTEG